MFLFTAFELIDFALDERQAKFTIAHLFGWKTSTWYVNEKNLPAQISDDNPFSLLQSSTASMSSAPKDCVR